MPRGSQERFSHKGTKITKVFSLEIFVTFGQNVFGLPRQGAQPLWRQKPHQLAGATRGEALDGDVADAALLERERRGTRQVCRQLAGIRIVADERNAPPFGAATELAHDHASQTDQARARRSVFTAALFARPCASRFAVCFARTIGLVKISSISTLSQASP